MKRLFDFFTATIILILVSPLLLTITLLVWVWIGSPVFFRQLRPGLRETPFYLYKFRTMNNDKDFNGSLLPDAQRLTPLGRFLRKYSLDELPQFINVIKGDISLVGPRPLLIEYLPLYNKEQARRHDVKPGITGWAQINGRNAIRWEEKFKLDLWYVDNQSFWFDLKILWLTFSKVVRFEGINQPGNATMEKFKGPV